MEKQACETKNALTADQRTSKNSQFSRQANRFEYTIVQIQTRNINR